MWGFVGREGPLVCDLNALKSGQQAEVKAFCCDDSWLPSSEEIHVILERAKTEVGSSPLITSIAFSMVRRYAQGHAAPVLNALP